MVSIGETYFVDGVDYKIISDNQVAIVRLVSDYVCFVISNYVIINDDIFSVVAIEKDAFNWNHKLSSISVGSSIEKIETNFLISINNLLSISVDDGNKEYYSVDNCIIKHGEHKLILGCANSKIPKSVCEIGSGAFASCELLKTIDIHNHVTHIDEDAFGGCRNLVSVNLPSNLISLGAGAFLSCQSLSFIEIPSSVETIGAYAFAGCGLLKTITIPNKVNEISTELFRECSRLESVVMHPNIKRIGDYAFFGCEWLSVEIPYGVETIENCAFEQCLSLPSIVIPDSVKYIGNSAFKRCENLEHVTLSTNIKVIRKEMFKDCFSLKSIVIPEGVTRIEENAFENCSGLKTVTIPSSITTIGEGAFNDCFRLEKIICLMEKPIDRDFFEIQECIYQMEKVATKTIYVRDSCVDIYKKDLYWRQFKIKPLSKISHKKVSL